jgi:hypothetical protein
MVSAICFCVLAIDLRALQGTAILSSSSITLSLDVDDPPVPFLGFFDAAFATGIFRSPRGGGGGCGIVASAIGGVDGQAAAFANAIGSTFFCFSSFSAARAAS